MSIDIDGINYTYETLNNTATVVGYSDYSTNSRIIPNNIMVDDVSYEVISIESGALSGALWESITISDSVVTIGNSAFDSCSALTSIIIPDSVTTIGANAFQNCSALANVYFNHTTTLPALGANAFTGHPVNNSATYYSTVTNPSTALLATYFDFLNVIDQTSGLTYRYPNNVFDSAATLIACDRSNVNIVILAVVDVTHPVTLMADDIFLYFTTLQSVTFQSNSNLTAISNYAFNNCYALTSIIIPDSVITIGEGAFAESYLNSVIIGNNVTTIGNSAFDFCSSLTSIIIPDSVTTISFLAFRSSHLTSIIIPDSVTSLGEGAFSVCLYLTSVTIGNGVTSIGSYTFQYCSALTSIIIPASVTSIGDYAFENCSALANVYFYQNAIPVLGNNAFVLSPNNNTAWYLYGAANVDYLPPFFTFLKLINSPPTPEPRPPPTKTKNVWFGGNMNDSSKTSALRYSQLVRGRGPNYGSNTFAYNEVNAFGYYVQGGPGGSGAPPRNSF
jgi:hypothetical protein